MKYPLALAVSLYLSPALPALAAGGHDHGHAHAHDASHAPHDAHAAHAAQGHDQDQAEPGHGASPAKEAAPKAAKAHEAPAHGDAKVRILLKGAVERLKEGNRRYAEGRSSNPRRGRDQRSLVAKAQLPFAVVVGCSDSRVPPEILFDQGLGDLFVVRVAGNVVDDNALGSIEYAVEHLGARLIVVLGHERCGAVDAACKGGEPGGHVSSLVREIKPAVEVARRYAKGQAQMLLPTAVRANVERVVDQLRGSWPVLGPEVREGKVTVVGGIYDLDDGLVEFLP